MPGRTARLGVGGAGVGGWGTLLGPAARSSSGHGGERSGDDGKELHLGGIKLKVDGYRGMGLVVYCAVAKMLRWVPVERFSVGGLTLPL